MMTSNATAPRIIKDRTEKMFMLFSAQMPLKFAAAFPTRESIAVAKVAWQRGLAELSDEEISAGIEAMASYSGGMFPSLGEFKMVFCPRFSKYNVKKLEIIVKASASVYKKNMQEIVKMLKTKCFSADSQKAVKEIENRIDSPIFEKLEEKC